jgi:hypothetical protein
MKQIRLCNPNCIWLDPKENGQTKRKEAHLCTRYNKVLKHGIFHPELIACEECLYESYAI